ncbi:auxilin-like protein 1 isoform X1 [Salvia hispanica]|uniref:auxilin-like protein 1 isoform X1 n=1 Tax=Salvia hispanica TaxID=49212 RepID=UPI002009A102|nr:auxilin-like protein 1 isoform X1 [Salvia hispanica]
MESLSKSSHRRKHSTTRPNVFSSSFSFKTPYGDVLLSSGGDRKSLQLHEYSEIFSGSSSIPVLDLSAMDERAGSAHIRSSKLDYTNIFSGLTHDDVFVPYEELLSASAKRAKPRVPVEGRPSRQESGSRHSSRKTERPPSVTSDRSIDRRVKLQESGSPPSTVNMERPSGVASDTSFDEGKLQESGSLHPSTKTERPSGVASDQSTDEIEQQFNLSFNRTNQINVETSDLKTHIAELHAVPGFTHFVDGKRSHKGKNDRPPLLNHEVSRAWSFSAEVEPVNAKGGSSLEKSRLDRSHHVNEVNLKSPESDAPILSSHPTNLSDIKETRQSMASGFTSKEEVSPKIADESLEDFDDNSVDAVSVAALKKAIEQAQESIRIAKIIMERKKDGAQDGSKLRPTSNRMKVAGRETKIDHEAFGSKNNSTKKKYEDLDPIFPAPTGIDGKLTPSLSHTVTCFPAEPAEGKRVSENVETDREPKEIFSGRSKLLFASNHIQSERPHADEDVKVEKLEKNVEADEVQRELFASNRIQSERTYAGEDVKVEKLEKNVEADEEQREGKSISGCEAVDVEPAKAGNSNSLVSPMSELASNLERLEIGTEISKQRNITAAHIKRSEVVPELVEGDLHALQRTQGMEKSWEEDELSQATFVHAEESESDWEKVLSSSKKIPEHDKAVDVAFKSFSIFPEGGVNEQRENDRDDKEQHEKKLEECDKIVNARSVSNDMPDGLCNLVRNESLDQQKIDRKTETDSGCEVDGQGHAEPYDAEIRETRKNEGQLWFDQLKGVLLEVINKGKSDVPPDVGESKIKLDEDHQPQINDDKQWFADNADVPKSTEEPVPNQIEEEHVDTTYKSETIAEASHCPNVQKTETEKTDYIKLGAGRGEGQEATYQEDINEAVNLSGGEASVIFDAPHTNGSGNIVAETEESCPVQSHSKVEEHQKSVKNSEEDVLKSNGSVSALDEDKMEEGSSSRLDDEILRSNHLHRSASEEIFVKNELLDTFEGLPSDSQTEAVDVMDVDSEESLLQDEDVSKTTSDIHDAPQEYATENNRQDIPQDLESHFRGVELNFPDVDQVLEQDAERDEGPISDSSFEKTSDVSSEKSEECPENEKTATSNMEELSDYMVSDERKHADEQSEELHSQLHDEPIEMDKSSETEEAVDTDVNVEKDEEKHVRTTSMEENQEIDAKEGMQNFDSNDQQQRIEAIKKGREREKDRIVVERAIREARERAFAEVRERAERAAVERAATEVRQRVRAEAREKVEKPSVVKQPLDKAAAEARLKAERAAVERSTATEAKLKAERAAVERSTATEAKLKAERAAVERATAEARVRALEKAKSLKTSGELKAPADRHSTEKFSSSSRNNALKHSFSSSELETGTNVESAQRRKARLERHQRIMERAAKALAEKNMRDHLVQKEQAERNRLAESLDADVKRWATGKEGNLRALLSTLQYILGPESGWQSISLTEIITTAAVKKAYRKATLCVHPDKLQQRGASVQQKYICEKVFDLLKAAWSRFNSDER